MSALDGKRTRAACVTDEHSTAEPLMQGYLDVNNLRHVTQQWGPLRISHANVNDNVFTIH